MGKLWDHGFDADVCNGCPHKNGEADGVVGTAAQKFSETVGEDYCGLCGCPLKNLKAISNGPPEDCPRTAVHKGE